MNDNKNKIIKLKNFNHLEENKTYIYTLKDKDILSDKIEELEIVENNFKNNNDKSKINYFINDQIKKNNKNENDIEIELNEFNEIENINEEIIKKKLMKIKNDNKNEINLNQNKNFEKEFHSIEKFKKKNKKIKFSKILIENDINDNNNIDIIEENNNTKTEKFSFINNDEKEKLKKIEFRKKRKKNEIVSKEKNDKNIFLNRKIKHSLNEQATNNKNINFLNSINDYSLFLENIQNEQSTKENIIKTYDNNNDNNNINYEENKNSNINLLSEKKIHQIFSEKNSDIFNEIPTGKGVCTALYILKSRNILKKNDELFGRLKDKSYTTNDYLIKDKDIKKNNEINIEYRGEDGNKLKPREMARYQARIFHGDTTGIKNKEKKMLRKKNLIIGSHHESITQNILNYKQKKEQTPFVTIIQKQNNFSSFF